MLSQNIWSSSSLRESRYIIATFTPNSEKLCHANSWTPRTESGTHDETIGSKF